MQSFKINPQKGKDVLQITEFTSSISKDREYACTFKVRTQNRGCIIPYLYLQFPLRITGE